MKSETIKIRVSTDEKQALMAGADRFGGSLSKYILTTLLSTSPAAGDGRELQFRSEALCGLCNAVRKLTDNQVPEDIAELEGALWRHLK